jgi:hypothetical protein
VILSNHWDFCFEVDTEDIEAALPDKLLFYIRNYFIWWPYCSNCKLFLLKTRLVAVNNCLIFIGSDKVLRRGYLIHGAFLFQFTPLRHIFFSYVYVAQANIEKRLSFS